MKVIGIALIVFGIVAMIYGGFTYTTREKVLDIGPIQATAEKKKTVPLPPILGGVLFIGGVALIAADSRRTAK